MTKITQFAILGERCSGTNFLEESIKENFYIPYTAEFGNKHFFCFNSYDTQPKQEETLFIGIIRNPIYWLNSFSKELHHVPKKNKELNNFLFNDFYSVMVFKPFLPENKSEFLFKKYGQPEQLNVKDLNYFTNQKYKNIFELRKCKNYYLTHIMPKKVANYMLINYEDLLYNYEATLTKIQRRFGLIAKHPSFMKIQKYKKSDTYNYKRQRQITFTPSLVKKIWDNLDVSQENSLGYFMWDNNKSFQNKKKENTQEHLEQLEEPEHLEHLEQL